MDALVSIGANAPKTPQIQWRDMVGINESSEAFANEIVKAILVVVKSNAFSYSNARKLTGLEAKTLNGFYKGKGPCFMRCDVFHRRECVY